MNSSSSTGNHYPIASLYVGDLAPDVTEAILFEKFSNAGPVLSIRVCRDIVTRRSLGYAYVNYQNANDAECAIDTLNFEKLNGRPIRIMWSQRDPSLRRSGVGNIFIKNLDKTVDNKTLYDTFSVFGNILSCKVCFDDKAQSKGYGFVHYDSEEAAVDAIDKLNNKLVNGKKVFVGRFLSRKERECKYGSSYRFTNVYVKNLSDEYNTDEKLEEMFKPYGSITSAVVAKDGDGKSKGFGFVCFENAEEAQAAVEALDQKDMGHGKVLYVGRAQKKAEREAELRRKQDMIKMDRINRSQGVNLYVKNLDDCIDDERLQKEFSAFGTITSFKVMTDEKGISKGFGFVCFSTPEEATKAVTEMNTRIIVNKPLYVALAQRKEDREAQKHNIRMGRLPAQQPPQMGNVPMNYPGQPGMQPMGPGGLSGQPIHGQHPGAAAAAAAAAGGQYFLPVAPNNVNQMQRGAGMYGGPNGPNNMQGGAGVGGPQGGPGSLRAQGRWNNGGGPMNRQQMGGPGGPGQYAPRVQMPRGGQPGGPQQVQAGMGGAGGPKGMMAGGVPNAGLMGGPGGPGRSFVAGQGMGGPGQMQVGGRGGQPGGRGPQGNILNQRGGAKPAPQQVSFTKLKLSLCLYNFSSL